MSTQTKRGDSGNCKRTSKKQLFYRICAIFLAALMVGGMLFSALYILFIPSNASPSYTNPLMAIGLMYGDDVTVGFETRTITGFTIGSAVITSTDRSFNPLWSVNNSKVSATCDANLAKTYSTYSKTSNASNTVIGGYHIQLNNTPADRGAAEQLVNSVNSHLSGTSYYAIPCYINGAYRVRVGHFANEAAANTALNSLTSLKGAYTLSVVSPSDNGVSLINPNDDRILFEYDCPNSSNMGLEPIQSGNEKAYTVTPAERLYDGVFVYKRYTSSSVDGVSVINLLPLEEYIAGVIPWEISPSWHYESQRVFAIAARTYALQNIFAHSRLGFDLCNTTCCQAYLGCSRANDNVYNAISSTEGMVLSFNGKLASIYYSSSAGGQTVTATHAWGGGQAWTYLASQDTPWEKYSIRGNGIWKSEVSGEELVAYLRDTKGYSELKGARISSITINSYAGNTSYVYSITFKDSSGNSKTVTLTDSVRNALGKYVRSANFVVGKGSVTRSYDVVSNLVVTPENGTGPAYPNLYDKISLALFGVIDKFGKKTSGSSQLKIRSSYDDHVVTDQNVSVMTAAKYREIMQLIENGNFPEPTVYPGDGTKADVAIDKYTVTETITASSSGNFVFAGKGYGHGVGISQWGTLDLAEAGAKAEFILSTYFPGIAIMPYGYIN